LELVEQKELTLELLHIQHKMGLKEEILLFLVLLLKEGDLEDRLQVMEVLVVQGVAEVALDKEELEFLVKVIAVQEGHFLVKDIQEVVEEAQQEQAKNLFLIHKKTVV
jgi:hypothetical protein